MLTDPLWQLCCSLNISEFSQQCSLCNAFFLCSLQCMHNQEGFTLEFLLEVTRVAFLVLLKHYCIHRPYQALLKQIELDSVSCIMSSVIYMRLAATDEVSSEYRRFTVHFHSPCLGEWVEK